MRLWNPATGAEETCTHLPDPVRALTVLPDGRLAVAHGMHVAVFRPEDGDNAGELAGSPSESVGDG